jgi:succinate dehydrogenase / fumarate reductase membrane anchor subunit
MDYQTDRNRVLGLGSAKDGTREWWAHRLSAVALVPLALSFLWIVTPLIGGPRADVLAAFQQPFAAIATILFILVAFLHLASGLQEVIVDYVHGKACLVVLLVSTRLICLGLGFAGAFAVAKIAFGV